MLVYIISSNVCLHNVIIHLVYMIHVFFFLTRWINKVNPDSLQLHLCPRGSVVANISTNWFFVCYFLVKTLVFWFRLW